MALRHTRASTARASTMTLSTIPTTTLGHSDLQVSRICLGTMTFGEQVDEATAFALMDHAVARGINFIDTAEMHSAPARRDVFVAGTA